MKRTIFFNLLAIFIFSLFFIEVVSANNIYVDNTLPANCTSGNYSIANRDCNGSDGDAYTSVQAALNAMNGGDVVNLRGGTYQEGHIDMPRDINGTAWTTGNYNTIKSYPGEWAILDGQNNCSGYGSVIGYATYSASDLLSYWKFERIEIKNGSSSDRTWAAGFYGWGGPFWFRYCYIHDNLADVSSNNPGGIKGHVWHECIIEYCYFKDNGMTTGTYHNPGHIVMYSDYVEDPANVVIANTVHKNIIRYNYFSGGLIGVKYKNSQWLSLSNDGTHTTYDDYGDQIHHNVFENMNNYMIDGRQDFIQVYNNIFYNSTGGRIGIGEDGSGDREPFYACFYNNTLIRTRLGFWRDNTSGDDNSSYPWTDGINPHLYCYNNIIESVSLNGSGIPPLAIMFNYSSWDLTDIKMDKVTVENNFFASNVATDLIITVGDNTDDFSANRYKSHNYADVIYTNTSITGLRAGYKTNGDYVLEGSTTIANGGIGGNHPYFSGVTIPSYVGATNPDDNNWADGVLSLANVTTLMNGGSGDPDWIEGGASSLKTPHLSLE